MELLNKEIKRQEGVRNIRKIIDAQTEYDGEIGYEFFSGIKEYNINCDEYTQLRQELTSIKDPKVSITSDNYFGLYNTLNTEINTSSREINYKLRNARYFSGW